MAHTLTFVAISPESFVPSFLQTIAVSIFENGAVTSHWRTYPLPPEKVADSYVRKAILAAETTCQPDLATGDMECYAKLNRCLDHIRCAPCMMVFVLRM